MADVDALGFAQLFASPQVSDPQYYRSEYLKNAATNMANNDVASRQRAGQLFAQGDYAGAAAALAPADMKSAIGLQDRTSLQAGLAAANQGDQQGAGVAGAATGDPAMNTQLRQSALQINAQQVAGLQGIASNLAKFPPSPGDLTNDPTTPRAQALKSLVQAGFARQFGLTDEQVMKTYGGSPGDLADDHLKAVANFSLPFNGTLKEGDVNYANGQVNARGGDKPVVAGPDQRVISNTGTTLSAAQPLGVKVGPGEGLRDPQTGAPLGATQPFKPEVFSTPLGNSQGYIDGQGQVHTPDGVSPSPASASVSPASGAGGHNGPGGGSLGDRSNNPGNIRPPPGGQWQGQIGTNAAGYAVFDNAQDGARALDRNLAAYAGHGITTPQALVERWASTSPPNEKAAYAARIQAAVGPQFDLNNPATRAAIAPAIAASEGTHLPTGSPKGPTDAPMPGQAQSGTRAAVPMHQTTVNGVSVQQAPDGRISELPGAFGPAQVLQLSQQIAGNEEVKQAQAAQAAYSALKGNAGHMTGPAAYSILDTFARAINPGAVARAGTIENLKESVGPVNGLLGRFQNLKSQGDLTPQVQQQFLDAVLPFVSAHYDQAAAQNARGAQIAQHYGADPKLVQVDIGQKPTRYVLGQQQGQVGPRGAPPVPADQALSQARAYVAAHPQARAQVIGRLRGWGINPVGL